MRNEWDQRNHGKTQFALFGILSLLWFFLYFGLRCNLSKENQSCFWLCCFTIYVRLCYISECSSSLPMGELYFPTPLRSDRLRDMLWCTKFAFCVWFCVVLPSFLFALPQGEPCPIWKQLRQLGSAVKKFWSRAMAHPCDGSELL